MTNLFILFFEKLFERICSKPVIFNQMLRVNGVCSIPYVIGPIGTPL